MAESVFCSYVQPAFNLLMGALQVALLSQRGRAMLRVCQ